MQVQVQIERWHFYQNHKKYIDAEKREDEREREHEKNDVDPSWKGQYNRFRVTTYNDDKTERQNYRLLSVVCFSFTHKSIF
mmetsp:Transcript_50414/g.51307  ORF Transcript_50414/g.51307 Transcript_50414/m.51307 type:complete len:81 (+) Transcript_50414:175-417(+)